MMKTVWFSVSVNMFIALELTSKLMQILSFVFKSTGKFYCLNVHCFVAQCQQSVAQGSVARGPQIHLNFCQ